MAFQKKLPTSASGAKEFVKGSGRTAVWVVMILFGLGILGFAMPYLKRIPIAGGLLSSGQAMIPGQAAGSRTDQWGRRA